MVSRFPDDGARSLTHLSSLQMSLFPLRSPPSPWSPLLAQPVMRRRSPVCTHPHVLGWLRRGS
jgi:hypothetical protein